jgi:hypothetical protein
MAGFMGKERPMSMKYFFAEARGGSDEWFIIGAVWYLHIEP